MLEDLSFFDNGHSSRCESISLCGFDLMIGGGEHFFMYLLGTYTSSLGGPF